MKKEIDSGEYELIRTNLAREVYSKLISDLDYQPAALSLTWEQRIQQLNQIPPSSQIEGGETIDGTIITETVGEQENQHKESLPIVEGK